MQRQRGPGWKLSDDGRKRIPDNYDPSNPEHRKNAGTIAFREGNGPAADYGVGSMGIRNNVVIPAAAGAILAVGTPVAAAGYLANQARMGAKSVANTMDLRTPSGIPDSEKRRLVYSGKSVVGDTKSLVRGIGNLFGRERSGLSQKEKEFAKANPSDDFLSPAERKYLDDRKGLLKGGRSRKVRRNHKRKSIRKGKGKKSKGRKTLHKRRSKRSRKSRK